MTILTKPFSDSEKLVTPLVNVDPEIGEVPTENATNPDGKKAHPRIIILPTQARRVSSSTILFLLIIAITGVSVGVIGGKIVYNEFISVSRRLAETRFKNDVWVPIPLNLKNDEDWKDFEPENENHFEENFEIDTKNKYEKIDVPDFKFGRNGRFIHDFNTNVTGIIDLTGQRCFVMPLNRETVLPPGNLFDLVNKMWDGYYKVNTALVRENMKVVTPPIRDRTEIGYYIAKECKKMPIYKLENYVDNENENEFQVFKRSVDSVATDMKFGQFAGEGIWEINIINMHDVLAYENNAK